MEARAPLPWAMDESKRWRLVRVLEAGGARLGSSRRTEKRSDDLERTTMAQRDGQEFISSSRGGGMEEG